MTKVSRLVVKYAIQNYINRVYHCKGMNMSLNTHTKKIVVVLPLALLSASQLGYASEGGTGVADEVYTGSQVVVMPYVMEGDEITKRIDDAKFFDSSGLVLGDDASSRKNFFYDSSAQVINGTLALSEQDIFKKSSVQYIYKGMSTYGLFGENSKQIATGADVYSVGAKFNDDARQEISNKASSSESSFHGRASQAIGPGGLSLDDVFTESATQLMNSGDTNAPALSMNSKFSGNSGQLVGLNSSSGNAQFTDNAKQIVTGTGSVSYGSTFTGASTQTIQDGGSSNNATFSDNASQMLEDGAQSENTTFNDNSSGMVGANAQMSGNTTLNGNAVLTAIAAYQTHAEARQIDNIAINQNARLNILGANNSDSANEVTAGTITMNGGTIQFGHEGGSDHYSTLLADTVTGSGGNLIMNGNLATHHNDVLSTGSMAGWYDITLNNQDSGREIAGDSDLLNLIQIDNNKGTVFTLTTVNPDTGKPTPNNHGADQGTHKVVVVTKKDPITGKTVVGLITDTSKTSNSTDAVMGLASATQYIFDGEMQALRTRRGDIQRFDQGEGGVWGRYLHNSSDIKAGADAGYRLGQNGMELGGDKVFDVADGKLSVGAMTSYSKSSVKQRGDSSQVSSYGVGLYSSYLSSLGYYIDGVVKFNHFNNDLHTRTDRGQAVKGSYDQDGYGAALEAGYQYTLSDGINIDPYARASYFAAQGKDIELSNGMKAAIGRQKSAKGELGLSVGKAFEVRSVTLSPYITAAVEHEFLKDNKVTFNDRYTYKNDQSGTLGKFGAGLTAQVTKNAQVYVEADYRKGKKVESPIMGNAGFRINF